MKEFKNVLNGETIQQGSYKYTNHRGMYGYMCAMDDEVIFIYVVDDELNCDVLNEFKITNNNISHD